jgi:hypothetical protein
VRLIPLVENTAKSLEEKLPYEDIKCLGFEAV